MGITISGWGSDDRVPGVGAETLFGQGRIVVSSIALVCLLMGNMTSAGSATPDTEVYDIDDEATAQSLFGARSELAQGCYAALEVDGVNLKAIAITEASGTQATLTMTVSGSWTADGVFSFWFAGEKYSVTILSTDTTTTAAAKIADAITDNPKAPATAANVSAVTTVTIANDGPRGNDYIVVKDAEETGPAGFAVALAGGTALTGGAVPFSSGATSDDITAALATLDSEQYDRIACAANDTTNADRLRDAVNDKAGPLKGLLEHFVFARTRTLTAATTFGQTDLNEYRGQVYWSENQETHPFVISAWIAAHRSVTEGSEPNPNYDDVEVPVATPQKFQADWPTHSEQKTALNNSVSPLKTTRDGRVTIVRAITSHSLFGALADYRTYDVGEAVVPDRIRTEAAVYYLSEWKVANPYVGPDVASDAARPPAGVGTPSQWIADVTSNVLRPAEEQNWIMDVDSNPAQAEWDAGAKRIMSALPVVVRPHNHQIGISVRQRAA